jgi:hypothetical protein
MRSILARGAIAVVLIGGAGPVWADANAPRIGVCRHHLMRDGDRSGAFVELVTESNLRFSESISEAQYRSQGFLPPFEELHTCMVDSPVERRDRSPPTPPNRIELDF